MPFTPGMVSLVAALGAELSGGNLILFFMRLRPSGAVLRMVRRARREGFPLLFQNVIMRDLSISTIPA